MKTWVIVASRTKASVYQTENNFKSLELLERLDNPAGRLRSSEIETNSFGTNYRPAPPNRYRHAQTLDPHEQAAQSFAKRIASFLSLSRSTNRFDSLVLVAEPKLLGRVRTELDSPTALRIVRILHKDLVNGSDHQLCRFFKDIWYHPEHMAAAG